MRRGGVTFALALLLCAGAAHADPVFTGRVSLTGLYYGELNLFPSDVTTPAMQSLSALGTTATVAYGELRGVLEGKRLWKDRLDLRLDVRLRVTGTYDFENKYSQAGIAASSASDQLSSLGTSARGYLGGPEYDLREAYGLLRVTDRFTLQAGRMFVREADSSKIDGVRVLQRFGAHWEGSAFAGGYPNPYSRSLLTDYTPPCGAGVAGTRLQSVLAVASTDPNSQAPCVTDGPQASFAAGLTARYDYASLWGSIGLTGTVFGGAGDGGPATPADKVDVTNANILQPPNNQIDSPRIFLSWINSWRPIERLDLFSDLVFDLYGSAGPQLTRLVALGTLRLLKDDRLVLRLGYSHMSSLAINMFLNRMLYNRVSGTTLAVSGLSVVENNLTVLRTGRDEVRATADFKVARRLGLYVDGRFRYRALIGADSVPGTYTDTNGFTGANLGGDVTVGARDYGTVAAIRAGLAYTALINFRAKNHLITLDLGRDFLKERLSLDFQYVFVYTVDDGIGMAGDACNPGTPFFSLCYGWRRGTTHELGLTLTASPWKKMFLLLDYRMTALLTDPQVRNDPQNPDQVPTVISNALLLRAEYRW